MKKTIFTLAVCIGMSLISPTNASAQTTSENPKKVSFGIRAGMNISSIGGDFKDATKAGGLDTKSKIGFNLGGVLDIYLNDWLYIQPGLSVTTKGTKFEGPVIIENVQAKGVAKGNPIYLQIPVLLSNRFQLGQDIQWQLNYGLYMAYGVGGKMTQEFSVPGSSQKIEVKTDFFGDSTDSFGFNRFDAGLVLGTGFSFSQFYVGLQYEMGLVNAANDKYWGYEAGGSPTYKMNNFSINVGYNF